MVGQLKADGLERRFWIVSGLPTTCSSCLCTAIRAAAAILSVLALIDLVLFFEALDERT
jgi:hypothetical protein